METLEKLGLKQKLSRFGNPNNPNSLSWWINKEPLRSKPVGLGSGRTAESLGLDIIAHETNNFLAYESITRSRDGAPNVLISRAGQLERQPFMVTGFILKLEERGQETQG